MILFSIILINLIWVTYSITEGCIEGFYWHYENLCKRVCGFNINPVFNLQRFIVLGILTTILFNLIGYASLLILFCLLLEFGFFHNGTYYYTRNKLGGKVYKKGWKDESKTFPTFSPLIKYKYRVSALLISIITQLITYLIIK